MLDKIFKSATFKVTGWTIISIAVNYFTGVLTCYLFPAYTNGTKHDFLQFSGIGFVAWMCLGTFLVIGWMIHLIKNH